MRADPRFADNAMVTGEPILRFYAGAPLLLPTGACYETREVHDLLVAAGCDAMQGYFLSCPLEADALVEFMRRQDPVAAALVPHCADAGTPTLAS